MITLRNISKKFGDKPIFTDFSMTVRPNEKVLISAPSGSGKTTLIRMMMGFEVADQGTIEIASLEVEPKNIQTIRQQISYVSQDTDLSFETVNEAITAVFAYKVNRHIDQPHKKFQSLCQTFGLQRNIAEASISKLSGGERQRVALIIALIIDRPILILDEITSGLDTKLKNAIAEYLTGSDKTVIIVSHDEIWKSFDQVRKVSLV